MPYFDYHSSRRFFIYRFSFHRHYYIAFAASCRHADVYFQPPPLRHYCYIVFSPPAIDGAMPARRLRPAARRYAAFFAMMLRA